MSADDFVRQHPEFGGAEPDALAALARIADGDDHAALVTEMVGADPEVALFDIGFDRLRLGALLDHVDKVQRPDVEWIALTAFEHHARPFVEAYGVAAAQVAYLAGGPDYPRATADALALGWQIDDLVEMLSALGTASTTSPWERNAGDTVAEWYLRIFSGMQSAGYQGDDMTLEAWDRLRLQQQRKVDAAVSATGDGSPLAGSTVVRFGGQAAPNPTWVIDGIVAAGEFVELAAPAFSGKTWFATYLACCVATGTDALGRSTAEGPVLWIGREEPGDRMREKVARVGFDERDVRANLMMVLYPQWDDLSSPTGGAMLRRTIDEYGPFALVVVDTLAAFVHGSEVSAETYRGLHRHAIVPVQQLGAQAPALMFLDHLSHERSTSPRGSTAKLDAADAVWIMRRRGGRLGADVTDHQMVHGGRVRVHRPDGVSFRRTFGRDGSCRFGPVVGGDDDLDPAAELTMETAILSSLPIASEKQLEDAVRQQLGPDFARNNFRTVTDQLVSTGRIARTVGARGAKGYDRA